VIFRQVHVAGSALTDATEVKEKEGKLGLRKKQAAVMGLIPGLKGRRPRYGRGHSSEASGAPASPNNGAEGNAFNGRVKGVQLFIADAAENVDHLISPEMAVHLAMARQ
jgi:hypothetical protein